jgi:hypothetical protein
VTDIAGAKSVDHRILVADRLRYGTSIESVALRNLYATRDVTELLCQVGIRRQRSSTLSRHWMGQHSFWRTAQFVTVKRLRETGQ